jgi:hypothetical protein
VKYKIFRIGKLIGNRKIRIFQELEGGGNGKIFLNAYRIPSALPLL